MYHMRHAIKEILGDVVEYADENTPFARAMCRYLMRVLKGHYSF
jgi:hypothetical protein